MQAQPRVRSNAQHGALFRINDGLCIWGPCLHIRLSTVPVILRDGDIELVGENYTPPDPRCFRIANAVILYSLNSKA